MGNIKEINIKNRTYYFFNDMVNIKHFDSSLLKMDKKSYKSNNIYNIRYIILKKIDNCENINSANPLYLMIGEVNRHMETMEINVFHSLDENKKLLKKYNELWHGVKNKIESINNGEGKYGKDLMKIKFDSDHNLPLNKSLNLHVLKIFVRSVFEDDGRLYPQFYLDECLYQLRD